MGEVATIQEHRAPMMAGGRVQAIVPNSMEEAYRLAVAICKAQMAPKGLDTPEKAMIAIMHGLEVGLTPMQALQRIAVVNGRPVIWGDGAMALVRGSGLCEYVKESISGEGEKRVASCAAKRRGEAEEVVRTFSVADAKKAGLWGKQGPWTQYSDRMLQMRARAFALRDLFADVLGGLYLREEIDDAPPAKDIAPPTPPPAPAPQIEAPEAPSAEETVDPDTGEITDDAAKLLPPKESAALKDGLLKQLGRCGTTEAIAAWAERASKSILTMQADDREELQEQWHAREAELFEKEQGDAEEEG